MLNFLSSLHFSGPVIITGASGWLGQAALEMFREHDLYAYGSRARRMTLRNGRRIDVQPLQALSALHAPCAIVFHFAFLTLEHAGMQKLEDYIAANRKISGTVQDFLKRNGAAGVFNPSSGFAYKGTLESNPYGALKREDEAIFGALGRQMGFPTALIRVFNLAGPFINKLNAYALACIISDILAARPVLLRAAHPVWRGYAHVEDVLNIALGTILRAPSDTVFDTGGEPIEISALAARAMALLGRHVEIQRPDWEDGAPNEYLGDKAAYEAQAARAGVVLHALDQQILDTAAYIRMLNG